MENKELNKILNHCEFNSVTHDNSTLKEKTDKKENLESTIVVEKILFDILQKKYISNPNEKFYIIF